MLYSNTMEVYIFSCPINHIWDNNKNTLTTEKVNTFPILYNENMRTVVLTLIPLCSPSVFKTSWVLCELDNWAVGKHHWQQITLGVANCM